MEDALHFCSNQYHVFPTSSTACIRSSHIHFPCINQTKLIHSRVLSSKTSVLHSTNLKPSSQLPSTHPVLHSDPHLAFREKVLYLESIGIDLFSVIQDHPPVVSSSLGDIKTTFEFMLSLGFTTAEFRRICGMCPEILTYRVPDIVPVFTFLLREANVKVIDLRRIINRRPRLLACNVEKRLRPTLYFLERLGIAEVHRHTSLLSCSVEDKFIPRMEYLEKIGFSHRDVISMVARFPQMLCYSIKNSFEPKFDYFVVEMRRDLKELKEFPQYFSFSLENRIRPRHRSCVEKGVCFPLPLMLTTSERQFRDRLMVCYTSSLPLKTSPLWRTN